MTATPSASPTTEFLQSANASTFQFNAGATITWPPGSTVTLVTANPGLSVSFSSNFQVVLYLDGASESTLERKGAIMDELVRRTLLPGDDPQKWDDSKYRVVTTLRRVQRYTGAMSVSDASAIQLEATGEAPPAGVDWLSANLHVQWSHQVGSVETWDAPLVPGQSYTPLFRLSHVYTFGMAIHHWVDTSGVGG